MAGGELASLIEILREYTRHSPQVFGMVLDIDQYCFPHVAFHNVVVDPDESVDKEDKIK